VTRSERIAPVGTRLRKAAATEDGGEMRLDLLFRPRARQAKPPFVIRPENSLNSAEP